MSDLISRSALIEAIQIKEMQIECKATRMLEFCEGLAMAEEALEKQIPKKVDDFMERTEDFSSFYRLDFMCPSCNNATIGQPYRPKYCKHCGQKLDWGD